MLDDLPSRTRVQLPAPPLKSWRERLARAPLSIYKPFKNVASVSLATFSLPTILLLYHLHLIYIPARLVTLTGIFFCFDRICDLTGDL